MVDKIEETVHEKTSKLNNPETSVLTHNNFFTYLVLNFSDFNKTQIYKKPYRDSPHLEIEILMGFKYWNVFRPNEHREDYHSRKPKDETFLFEIGDKKYIYVGEKVIIFETNNIIVKDSLDLGFNDIKIPCAYGGENFYFRPQQIFFPIQEYENSTENEYQYLQKKMMN